MAGIRLGFGRLYCADCLGQVSGVDSEKLVALCVFKSDSSNANAAVANYITESFSQMTGGSAKAGSSPKAGSSSGEGSAKGRFPISPVILYRFIKAKYMANKEERPMMSGHSRCF